MAQKYLNYVLVDAFTESVFKGNPAAVCFLEDDRDDALLQSLAAEFRAPMTCFLIPFTGSVSSHSPRFSLRWFTPTVEVNLCGHATLASAHVLFSKGLVDSDTIEFITRSGVLTAQRVPDHGGEAKDSFSIELNLPVPPTNEYNSKDVSVFSKALNGATIIDVKRTPLDYILVVLSSWESVVKLQPKWDDMMECPGTVIVATAAGPAGSAYDFYSRVFAPKLGIDEDPVCGSAHCALANYWSLKLNKSDFVAYAASPRSGTMMIRLDKEKGRVLLRGRAVTVMEGRVFC